MSQTLPLVGPPQSPSRMHSTHEPVAVDAEVQSLPAEQPLPPSPWQPDVQAFEAASQIAPLAAPPQSLSWVQPAHLPKDPSVEVQTRLPEQPLPSPPRQPTTQESVALSQTIPLLAPPQSLSPRQAAQEPIVTSFEVQMRLPEQPLPSPPRQPTMHFFELASQTMPLCASPQSRSLMQATQVPAAPSFDVQTSLPEQRLPSPLRHPRMHVFDAASQIVPLVAPPQSPSTMQPAQAPIELSSEEHTRLPEQPLPSLPRHPAAHVRVEVSQTEPLCAPPQSLSPRQPTQAPMPTPVEVHTREPPQPLPLLARQPAWQVWVPVSQTVPLCGPPQSLSPRHATQWPAVASVESHTRLAEQPLPPAPRQPSTHAWTCVSQMIPLWAPPQSPSARQATHDPAPGLDEVQCRPAPQPLLP